MESDDDALVRRMAEGDEQALGVLYDRWQAVVHGVVSRMLRQADDVEDVVEETFWQAWRQASRFDRSRGAVQTWLLTIARSRALDRVRSLRRRREEPLEGDDGQVVMQQTAEGDPGLDAEASERRTIVVAALAGASAEQREALELGYFGGLSQTEIAERTGQPLGTVKTRMRLAMQKLRGQLQVLGSDEGGQDERRHDARTGTRGARGARARRTGRVRARSGDGARRDLCDVPEPSSPRWSTRRASSRTPATPLPMPPAQRDRIRARLMARAAADRGSREPLAAVTPLRVESASAPARADATAAPSATSRCAARSAAAPHGWRWRRAWWRSSAWARS